MPSLRDFLAARRAEIKAQISALRDELRDIEAAESAIMDRSPKDDAQPGEGASRTIQDMVLMVLANHSGPMDALEIMHKIKAMSGADARGTSLSPQLSRLKADNKITLNGKLWSLADEPSSEAKKAPDDNILS